MKFKFSKKWRRILVICSGLSGMAVLSFNCAPSAFSPLKSLSSSSSSSSLGSDTFNGPSKSPIVMMTAKQTFQTMLNVSGQALAATTTQNSEYDSRAASLSMNEKLSNINAPLQLASTSLAGEVCNGLLAKETAAGATKKFFAQVDFTKSVALNSKVAFGAAIDVMAQSFWGRALTPIETGTLNDFYNDFIATAGTQAVGTRNLYLATCTGMLASLETYTF